MLEQYDTAKDLGLCPIPYDVQQTEWIVFEVLIICMIKVDIELISPIEKT